VYDLWFDFQLVSMFDLQWEKSKTIQYDNNNMMILYFQFGWKGGYVSKEKLINMNTIDSAKLGRIYYRINFLTFTNEITNERGWKLIFKKIFVRI
jgi:hypothetical protein